LFTTHAANSSMITVTYNILSGKT